MKSLNLTSFHYEAFVYHIPHNTEYYLKKYVFFFDEKVGELRGLVTPTIDETVGPKVLVTKGVPYAVRERIERELKILIAKVDESTN